MIDILDEKTYYLAGHLDRDPSGCGVDCNAGFLPYYVKEFPLRKTYADQFYIRADFRQQKALRLLEDYVPPDIVTPDAGRQEIN